ncbi:MAG: GNAT family N-acetyltransferase [Candidatus Delongbacteria bacterium]|nr:GNAT family N-acetyltransferase [Candidatus Delongbacteria bacterium]MBN2835459.1 GNAT family N-acetyltransferase [Candidatus Delongbacteria bacterium]
MYSEVQIVEYKPFYAKEISEMWYRSKENFGNKVLFNSESAVLDNEESSSHVNLYLAIDGEKVVGYCKLSTYNGDTDTLHIDLLSVDPGYHGKKIGKRLILKSLERTIELGYSRLDLFTWEGNLKAVPLYKKCGFFWTQIKYLGDNTALQMINFLPSIYKCELLKPYVEKLDLYNDSIRVIEIAPDSKVENKIHKYQYEWKKDEQYLKVEFEQNSRGISKIERPDFSITTIIEENSLIFGKEHLVKYEICNKSSKPLEIELKGISDKNIVFDFQSEKSVINTETIEANFVVNKPEKDYNSKEKSPSVKCQITIKGLCATFETGILAKLPLQLNYSSGMPYYSEESINKFYLEIQNNYQEVCEFWLDIPSSKEVSLIDSSYYIKLSGNEKGRIPVNFKLIEACLFSPMVSIRSKIENQNEINFDKQMFIRIPTLAGSFYGKDENCCILTSGPFSTYYDLKNSTFEIYNYLDENFYFSIRAPKLGKPYSGEFINNSAYKHEFIEGGGTIGLKLFFKSKEFDGVEFATILKLSANGVFTQQIEIISLSGIEKEIWLQSNFGCGGGYNYGNFIIPYEGKVIELGKDFLHNELTDFQSSKFTENWIYGQKSTFSLGICWPDNWQLNFTEDYSTLEFNMSESFNNGKMVSDQFKVYINTFNDVSKFKQAISNKRNIQASTENSFQLLVNNENPFVKGNAEVKLVENKNLNLKGKFNFKNSFQEILHSINLTEEDNCREISKDVDFSISKDLQTIDVIGELGFKNIQRRKVVFTPTSQTVSHKLETENNFQVLTVDNGVLQIKASADYAPTLFSLQHLGKEWLDSDYPKLEPKFWWNPWWGGIYHFPLAISNSDQLHENISIDFVTKTDNKGNVWQGIGLTTEFNKFKPLKGLSYRQHFLMLPNVPVLLHLTEILSKDKVLDSVLFYLDQFHKPAENSSDFGTIFKTKNNDIEKIRAGHSISSVSETNCSAIFNDESDYLLQLLFDSSKSIYTEPNGEFLMTVFVERLDFKEDSKKYLTPNYLIFTKELLDPEWLKDLKSLKFE